MVSNVSGGRSGIAGYLVQRASALILLAFTLCVVGTLLFGGEMDYESWRAYFSHPAMRLFTLAALVSLCLHAWSGLWVVATDYMIPRVMGKGATAVRLTFELICLIVLFAYLVWGVQILWSI